MKKDNKNLVLYITISTLAFLISQIGGGYCNTLISLVFIPYNFKDKLNKIKEKLKHKELILGIFVLVFFALLLINIAINKTHAFYNYESGWVPIFNSKVGNFAGEGESVKQGPLTERNSDVNLIFYAQVPDNPNKYQVASSAPLVGYKLNDNKSNCYPAKGNEANYVNSSIGNDGTVSITYTITKPTQVVCRIYYDRDKLSDVIIYAYLQDANGDKTYNSQKYKLVNQVESNYQLVGKECKSKTANTSFTYNNGFTITSSGPDTCYAYFSK